VKWGRLFLWIVSVWIPAVAAALSLIIFFVTLELKSAVFFVILVVLAFLGWAHCSNLEKS
jgi:hypothetical protein